MNFPLLLEKYKYEHLKTIKKTFDFRKLKRYEKVIYLLIIIDLFPIMILSMFSSFLKQHFLVIYMINMPIFLILVLIKTQIDAKQENRNFRLEQLKQSAEERHNNFLLFLNSCSVTITDEKLNLLKNYAKTELQNDQEQSVVEAFSPSLSLIATIITFFIGMYAEKQEFDTLLPQAIILSGFILLFAIMRMSLKGSFKSKRKITLESLIYDIDQILIFEDIEN